MFFTAGSSANNAFQLIGSLASVALIVSLSACNSPKAPNSSKLLPSSPSQSPSPVTSFNKPTLSNPVTLTGIGASLPAPLYQNWFMQINEQVPELQIKYQAIASQEGLDQLSQGKIDFAVSDVEIAEKDIAKTDIDQTLLFLPVTAGAIVLAYNLPSISELKLPQSVYSDIFLGKITKWDDPQIAEANPGIKLPNRAITVIHSTENDATTANFLSHLKTINPEWESQQKTDGKVNWPSSGRLVGATGNEGIISAIQQTSGSIGYVDYGYARNNQLVWATLQNKAGTYIKANEQTLAATIAAIALPSDLRPVLTNPEASEAYPLVVYTSIVAHPHYDDPQKAIALEAVIQYALTQGQDQSSAVGYVPLPPLVREQIATVADQISPDYPIKLK